MTAARFQAAVLRGMAASPFAGTVTVLMNGLSIVITGCLVDEGTNKVEVEEFGVEAERVIKAHIPKTALPRQPNTDEDGLIYQGRKYKLRPVAGDVACSPVWVVEARSPLK